MTVRHWVLAAALAASTLSLAQTAQADAVTRMTSRAAGSAVSTGASFAGGTVIGLAFALPGVLVLTGAHAAVVEHRELTHQEVANITVGTIVPPIGIYLMLREMGADLPPLNIPAFTAPPEEAQAASTRTHAAR